MLGLGESSYITQVLLMMPLSLIDTHINIHYTHTNRTHTKSYIKTLINEALDRRLQIIVAVFIVTDHSLLFEPNGTVSKKVTFIELSMLRTSVNIVSTL